MDKFTAKANKNQPPSAMTADNSEFENVLTNISERTSSLTGKHFFCSLVEQLAIVMGYSYALLAELVDDNQLKMQTLAVWSIDKLADNFIYDLDGTPCGDLVTNREVCHIYDSVTEKFPCDQLLTTLGAESYMGVPVFNNQDKLLGILVVLDVKPIPESSVAKSILTIFASRAGAEMTRLHSQRLIQQSLTELKESRQALDLRNQIAEVFLTLSDRSMYNVVLNKLLNETNSLCGVFGYIDGENNYICPKTYWDPGSQLAISKKDLHIPQSQWSGLWRQAIMEKKSLYHNEASKVNQHNVFSMISVPVIHHNIVIGNLLLCNKSPGYTDKDSQFLESISSFIAPVLNARLERDREENKRKLAEQQRQQLEQQLLQRGKMEAIGSLAGGIAHDFNNILMAINGYTEMAMVHSGNRKPLKDDLTGILTASNRATKLVNQILTFSSTRHQEVAEIKVQLMVKEVLELLQASLPVTIEIKTKIQGDCEPVMADPSQVHQVIMNLCTNAYHAMKVSGGVLEVALQQIECSKNNNFTSRSLAMGNCVCLTVTDSGIGMSDEVKKNIFEPYYTTKRKGEGTGLGLAMVNGIITHLEGAITVSSQPGRGTRFDVYIPLKQTACFIN